MACRRLRVRIPRSPLLVDAVRIDYKKLVNAAIKELDYAYGVPEGMTIYSAAVLSSAGKIYAASAYSSFTASLTLHGEQMALAHAAAHRDGEIVAMATVSGDKPKKGIFCTPCGMCKQLVWENSLRSGKPIKFIMANSSGEYIVKEISELVPYPWPASKK